LKVLRQPWDLLLADGFAIAKLESFLGFFSLLLANWQEWEFALAVLVSHHKPSEVSHLVQKSLSISELDLFWLCLVLWNSYRNFASLLVNAVVKSWSLLLTLGDGSNKLSKTGVDKVKSSIGVEVMLCVWNNEEFGLSLELVIERVSPLHASKLVIA